MKSTIDGIGAGSNLKFNNIKENYERYEDGMKAYVFDILPKEKNPCAYPVT